MFIIEQNKILVKKMTMKLGVQLIDSCRVRRCTVVHRNLWYSPSGRCSASPSFKFLSVHQEIPGAEVSNWDGSGKYWGDNHQLLEKDEHLPPGLYNKFLYQLYIQLKVQAIFHDLRAYQNSCNFQSQYSTTEGVRMCSLVTETNTS